MYLSTKELGDAGEELAAQFLLNQNYQILARNLKNRYGEIDIVAKQHDTIVFVEVKTKQSHNYGLPVEMVTPRKQQKLRQVATALARQYNMVEYRIDVVAISILKDQKPHIEHFIAAV